MSPKGNFNAGVFVESRLCRPYGARCGCMWNRPRRAPIFCSSAGAAAGGCSGCVAALHCSSRAHEEQGSLPEFECGTAGSRSDVALTSAVALVFLMHGGGSARCDVLEAMSTAGQKRRAAGTAGGAQAAGGGKPTTAAAPLTMMACQRRDQEAAANPWAFFDVRWTQQSQANRPPSSRVWVGGKAERAKLLKRDAVELTSVHGVCAN